MLSHAALNATIHRFEGAFARVRRRQRLQLVGFTVVFLVFVHIAAEFSNFRLDRLLAGVPRIGEYFGKTLPEIRLGTLPADIGHWYYGFWRWLGLLFDTLLIALMATLFGAIGGF